MSNIIMRTNRMLFIVSVLMTSAILAPAATNDASAALQRGLFEEEANHNLDAAIQAYQSVINQYDKDRKLAAAAIFRLAESYRKQGRPTKPRPNMSACCGNSQTKRSCSAPRARPSPCSVMLQRRVAAPHFPKQLARNKS